MKHSSEVRERVEEHERASLSTWATLASETKGRDRYEDPDPLRTAFQQDRERLLGTDAFARLAGKTFSYVPEVVGTGWRSQLGHTFATVGFTRTLTSALRLNEDLGEAVATGHALGAPPFAPAAQEVLAEVLGTPFEVSEQSLRIAEHLQPGLNLTWEVRDGILHQHDRSAAATLEGRAAALGRWVASAVFDLRAARRAGLVHLDDVPAKVRTVLGTDHGQLVSTVIADAVDVSADQPEVTVSTEVHEAIRVLETFLVETVHSRDEARVEHDRAVHCLRSLVVYSQVHTAQGGAEDHAGIVDWLTGATDLEIVDTFAETFLPGRSARE